MVAGEAAGDAVARARRLPGLAVGLHLVVIEGRSALAAERIPRLVGPDGRFGSDQFRRGWRYFADPQARRQLAAEITAQFEAFAATGLALDHANAHKHMHLHPVVGRMLVGIGQGFGLRAVRVPAEPAGPLGERERVAARAMRAWTRLLRAQVLAAGMFTTEHCFGLRWSGAMTTQRVSRLLDRLPPGSSEIYFHPAAGRDPLLDRLMPDYRHEEELTALSDDGLARRAAPLSIGWRDLCERPPLA